jgi:hypothetical protein
MRTILAGLVSILTLGTSIAVSASEVTTAGRWHLHSSFWQSLHQTLMHDASARTPRDLSSLSEEERKAWQDVVSRYREARGEGSITFSGPMMELQDELTQVADDAVDPTIRHALGEAILEAAPIYREHWWADDDAANRFYIGYVAAMLEDAGEQLLREHERVYGEEYPATIRIDVAPHAGTYGGYTHSLRHGVVVTVASRDLGNHGLTALELVVHESSHAIVFPSYGRVARAIAAAAGERGIDPPRDLWHAILFATSGELTRRALAEHGVGDYVATAEDLLTRAWPQYREPLETFWHPYLEGTGSLEDAIGKVVAAVE